MGAIMKRLFLITAALVALVAVSSANAADLPPAQPVYKTAPIVAPPPYNWTGCFLGGGGGFGMWNDDNTVAGTLPASTAGGRGYFGQGQAGCDYQFNPGFINANIVVGVFGDGEFGSLKSHTDIDLGGLFGQEKETGSWAVGGRAGLLVTPKFLTYMSGGYTQASFDQVNLATIAGLTAVINSHTYNGYFLGSGFEYGFDFLPGLFLKTEYRFSSFESATLPIVPGPGSPAGLSVDSTKYSQTLSTELVWRFNFTR
jgi:outer membrane immunogenic protein